MINLESIRYELSNFNFINPLYFEPKNLIFSKEFRKYCIENKCGYFGTNWMCPPGIGDIEDLRNRALGYKYGIVFFNVNNVDNVKDEKIVNKIRDEHNKRIRDVSKYIKEKYCIDDILSMGAGPCTICSDCSYKHGRECIHKNEAISSPEAYGIDVGKLLESVGLKLEFEDDKISFVGIILFNIPIN